MLARKSHLISKLVPFQTKSLSATSQAASQVQFSYKTSNEEVELSYLTLKSTAVKPIIVMHGLLGSKKNWRTLCNKKVISDRRKPYLVEMRNHAMADHHNDHSYEVMSEDIVRFADA